MCARTQASKNEAGPLKRGPAIEGLRLSSRQALKMLHQKCMKNRPFDKAHKLTEGPRRRQLVQQADRQLDR